MKNQRLKPEFETHNMGARPVMGPEIYAIRPIHRAKIFFRSIIQTDISVGKMFMKHSVYEK